MQQLFNDEKPILKIIEGEFLLKFIIKMTLLVILKKGNPKLNLTFKKRKFVSIKGLLYK